MSAGNEEAEVTVSLANSLPIFQREESTKQSESADDQKPDKGEIKKGESDAPKVEIGMNHGGLQQKSWKKVSFLG